MTIKVAGSAVRDEATSIVRCTVRMTGGTAMQAVTEIEVPRELAAVLGASPPSGFTEEPYVAGPKVGDQAFVDDYNKTTVRWVGETPLPPEQNVVFSIPVKHPRAGSGIITFQYESRGKFGGGTIAWCKVELQSL